VSGHFHTPADLPPGRILEPIDLETWRTRDSLGVF